jgi:phospholipid-binding lipoprotein MlaA
MKIIHLAILLASLSTLYSGVVNSQDVLPVEIDHLEKINRQVYDFNTGLDDAVIRPVAAGYQKVTPTPVKNGVKNVLSNLGEVSNATNALLQGRIDGALISGFRLLINSTLGLAGIFDVANKLGVEQSRADFGQTLARWGVPQGPYLMLPILGPSTLRDTAGLTVDVLALGIQAQFGDVAANASYWSASAIETRRQLLAFDDLVSGDRYVFVRESYLQNRNAFLGLAPATNDFGDFGGFDEISDADFDSTSSDVQPSPEKTINQDISLNTL